MDKLLERFSIKKINSDIMPRYNIAPSQQVLTVINDGEKNRIGYIQWGLIPSWAKDAKIGSKMINARAETLSEKPSFRQAYKKRRCLVLADGFFEWKKDGEKKVPMCIRFKAQEPFGMAGLWERWISPSGETIHSCTIVTTQPNELMKNIHDRMPVILGKEEEQIWLDKGIEDPLILNKVLSPYSELEMEAYQVSSIVNSPKNDSPQIIAPV